VNVDTDSKRRDRTAEWRNICAALLHVSSGHKTRFEGIPETGNAMSFRSFIADGTPIILRTPRMLAAEMVLIGRGNR
jgi:hypothetical protein